MPNVALPSVTEILRVVGLGPDLSRIDPDVLEAARDRGSAVHAAIEALHYGFDYTLDPEYKPWLDAYLRFAEETEHQPIVSECELVHPRWRYCGHPDRVGWHRRTQRALYDWKCGGAEGVQYQLAAYWMAWNDTRPTEPVDVVFAVQFCKDGSYRLHEIDVKKAMPHGFTPVQVWQAALVTFNARGGR